MTNYFNYELGLTKTYQIENIKNRLLRNRMIEKKESEEIKKNIPTDKSDIVNLILLSSIIFGIVLIVKKKKKK
jgi:hypothetical protein